jgi:hypothetical protein
LQGIEDDVDLAGTNITQQARQVLEDAIDSGLTHLLVDYPTVGTELNLAEERELDLRPTFVHIKAEDLIGWRSAKGVNGEPILTQIRWRDNSIEPDGAYGDKVVERIRVMTTDAWEIWERKKVDGKKEPEYVLVAEGAHTFGGIPLATMYTNRTGFMTGRPALEPLGYINLAHYQSQSDHRNMLRFARIGILFLKGFSSQEVEEGIAISVNGTIETTNSDADGKYIEYEGKALEAGKSDLDELRRQAEVIGVQPMVDRANPTRIGQAIGESKNASVVQGWVRAEETLYEQAYEMGATWTGDPLPAGFAVDIFDDFGVKLDDHELDALLKSRALGDVSHQTFLRELQRRGVLSDKVVIEDEVQAAEDETAGDLEGLEG